MELLATRWDDRFATAKLPTTRTATFSQDFTQQRMLEMTMRLSEQIAQLEAEEDAGNFDEEHPVRKVLYILRENLKLPEAD